MDSNLNTSKSSHLFLGGGLLDPPPKRLGSGVAGGAGQTVVAGHCVLTAMHPVVCVTGVRDLFTLVDVLADDAISSVANRTPATLEGAIRETGALGSSEARTGEATIYRSGQTQQVVLDAGTRVAPFTITCSNYYSGCLPIGHSCLLHTWDMAPPPTQWFPPYFGAGSVQRRLRIWIPPPHVKVQVSQRDQGPHPPWTRRRGNTMFSISLLSWTLKLGSGNPKYSV